MSCRKKKKRFFSIQKKNATAYLAEIWLNWVQNVNKTIENRVHERLSDCEVNSHRHNKFRSTPQLQNKKKNAQWMHNKGRRNRRAALENKTSKKAISNCLSFFCRFFFFFLFSSTYSTAHCTYIQLRHSAQLSHKKEWNDSSFWLAICSFRTIATTATTMHEIYIYSDWWWVHFVRTTYMNSYFFCWNARTSISFDMDFNSRSTYCILRWQQQQKNKKIAVAHLQLYIIYIYVLMASTGVTFLFLISSLAEMVHLCVADVVVVVSSILSSSRARALLSSNVSAICIVCVCVYVQCAWLLPQFSSSSTRVAVRSNKQNKATTK